MQKEAEWLTGIAKKSFRNYLPKEHFACVYVLYIFSKWAMYV